MDISRVHVMVWQLRDKIRDMTALQRRIRYDMDLFIDEGDLVRGRFEETRKRYLNLLDLSVADLREMMSTSDLTIPTDDFDVEDIMKRVRPVSERYLQRLVNGGHITENDMECILVGGYQTVDEFFHDLKKNVGMFGLKVATNWSPDVSNQEPDASQLENYDEDGFLVTDTDGDKDSEETNNSTTVEPKSTGIIPPVVLLPPSGPFSWADDVEDELESLEPLKPSDQKSLETAPLPQEEERSPVDASFPSDASDSHSDVSSEFDFDVSLEELSSILVEPEHGDPEPEQEEEVQSSSQNLSPESPDPDTSETIEQPQPAIIQTYRELSSQTDSDAILDEWLYEQDMWFWQYEAFFVMTVAARHYKKSFEEARGAYKADPFADLD
ncbi:hypothetical protein F4781DRAFT_57264 [Annulohypoxylon bovei var. microspora]|nr:hypothetical protein F4781DRAFT_57264 [Annulohypoxylon bovei var. microspora]